MRTAPAARTDPTQDADVAVVGYGPVGATLTILLAQLGLRVVVLERRPAPNSLPRAVHFDDGAGRILEGCGVGEELRRRTQPVESYEWRNGLGTPLMRIGRSGPTASGWPLSSMFHQPDLEAALDRRARALPGVHVRRGSEVVDLRQDGDGVALGTAAGATVRAAYAVGCDGAGGTVRSLVGAPMRDLGFAYDWLVADVVLDHRRDFDPPNLQVCDPARPTTAVSGGPGRRRWEFMRLPDETAEELATERRAWELLAGWGVHAGNARLERSAVYTFRAAFADCWRVGRVLLAGDAAHLMPPFAGQGLCAGIRDAANLAWKLALVVTGWATAGLLDTYQLERLPDVRTAIDFSVELGKVICVLDEAEAAARDAAMSALVGSEPEEAPSPPPLTRGLIAAGSPLAGEPCFHGDGWQLVGVADPALDSDTRSWFESIGGHVTVRPGRPEPAAFALQRPDYHLYGTAPDAAGAAALLARLRSSLQRQA